VNLWLARHAQPLIGAGVCYGATDMPADADATRAAAAALAPLLPHAARVWCSPLRRCAQLAEQLQLVRPDLAPRTDARLAEMDFGCWEGVRWDAIPRDALDAWSAQFWQLRFGGRESVAELMARVALAREDARKVPGPLLWITHAGVIRAATLLERGVTILHTADQWPQEGPGFGQVVAL